MSPENRQANIDDELAHSDEAMRAADALFSMGLLRDAMNRLYYALFHMSLALLLTEDLEPASHRGLQSLFGLHLVKTGKLPAELGATLRRAQAFREAADYTRGFVVPEAECRREFEAARAFLAAGREFLKRTPGT